MGELPPWLTFATRSGGELICLKPSLCNRARDWAQTTANVALLPARKCCQRRQAKRDGHDPYSSLTEVRARLPTRLARQIDELLPNRWTSSV